MKKIFAKRNNDDGLKQICDALDEQGIKYVVETVDSDRDPWNKYHIYELDATPDVCSCCDEEKPSPYTSAAFPKLCKDCHSSIFFNPPRTTKMNPRIQFTDALDENYD